MKSTISLYYSSLVEKTKNFRLDNAGANAIDIYLSTLAVTHINNFQYIKQGLALNIKIDTSQTALEMGPSTDDLNYCRIQNGSGLDAENPCYYFILSKTWKSRNTIELSLAMDTLNTFQYDSDYIVDQKTFVKRMHKPRFYDDTPEDQDDTLVKRIDLKSENISAPSYKVVETTLNERDGRSTIDWKLYYRTSDNQQTTPIDCYLVPSETIQIQYQGNAGEFNAGNIPTDTYLLFFADYNNPSITFNIDGTMYTPTTNMSGSTKTISAIALFNDNDTDIKVYFGSFYQTGSNPWLGSWYQIATNPATLKVLNPPSVIYSYDRTSLPTAVAIITNEYWKASFGTHQTAIGSVSTGILNGAASIDKTLSENVKIIAIPYSPTSFSVDANNRYTFDSCWEYQPNSKRLKLIDFNKRFKNSIVSNGVDFYGDLYYHISNYNIFNGTKLRRIPDPKLLHSDFYKPKFVYDSFSKVFALEQIKAEYDAQYSGKFNFDFVMSRNLVSKFLFKFNYEYDNATDDYENIVCVSRNNEEVLFNSQYLDYIRTGYNYDLKAKERQEITGAAGIGLNMVALAASLGIGMATGNPIAIGSAVVSGIGLVNQTVNYAKSTAQNEENIQRKIQETQRQAISVMNADDYDLLYEYSQNKAKLVRYQVSPNMRAVLDDLFYYGGYVVNEQTKPSTNTRYWFNYVEADLVISQTNNLTDEIVSDIQEKFSNGVTFMHLKQGTFDLEQKMENFENFLYHNVT